MTLLGERIRAARQQAGLSQPELAEQAGVSKSFVSMLETGKRTRVGSDILARIAAVLNTTTDAFLSDMEPLEDLSQPPVELFQAAGYSPSLIARLAESWPRRPAAWRLEKVTQARRRVDEVRELEQAIL